jgi:hypothetical protein
MLAEDRANLVDAVNHLQKVTETGGAAGSPSLDLSARAKQVSLGNATTAPHDIATGTKAVGHPGGTTGHKSTNSGNVAHLDRLAPEKKGPALLDSKPLPRTVKSKHATPIWSNFLHLPTSGMDPISSTADPRRAPE